MDLTKKILAMLRKGMSMEDIKLALLDEDSKLEVKTMAEAVTKAQKIFDSEKEQKDQENQIAKQKEMDELITKKAEDIAKKQVEAALKEIKVNSSITTNSEHIEIKENPGVWKAETAEYFKLAKNLKTLNDENRARFYELAEKNFNSQADYYKRQFGLDLKTTNSGSFVGTDANGGYWVRQEFDAEVDKLMYTSSDLINNVQVRPGDEKIAINGIQTVDYSYRTNDDTNWSKVQPTFTQDTITLKDAGAILAVSNRLLESSFYDIAGELVQVMTDAEIRLLEQQMTTGDDNESDEVFDGMWFTSGITSLAAKNAGGSGAIDPSDLHNAYLSCAAQSRKQGFHLLRTEEFQYLYGLKDTTGRPIGDEIFMMVNGQWMHKGTGRPVLVLDQMEKVNGVTNKTSQPNVPYMFAVLPRFRYYRKGGRKIDFSDQRYFEYSQVAWRFVIENVQGIPTNSLSSFVAVTGLVETAVS